MSKKLLLIVNPISGILPKREIIATAHHRLEAAGYEVETRATERAGHALELAREAAERGYYAVVAAGGDGTVNEVASGIAGSDTVLGIMPLGSGNGLARHVILSIDIDRAIDVIAADRPKRCDYGTANGRPFFCTFGMGFDAEVSRKFSSAGRRGLISYLQSAFKVYLKYKSEEYEISTPESTFKVKAFLVAVCNASQYGNNAFIAPSASIHDGLLDITVIHSGDPFTRAMVGVELFTGRINSNIIIQTIRTPRAIIRKLPGTVHIDGDVAEMPERVEVTCHPSSISIFCDPKGKKRFRPILTPIRSLNTDIRFFIRFLFKRILRRKKTENIK